MNIVKISIIKGGICGLILSCLISLFIILSFCKIPFDFLSYGVAIISAILALLFFINNRISKFVYSFFSSIIVFLVAELVVGLTGIIRIFFKIVNGASQEMWAGDGFGMLVIFSFSISGYFLGSVIALIITIIKMRKNRTNSMFP